MATGDYTTVTAVKAQRGIDGTLTADDSLLQTYVTEASRWIDAKCNRAVIDTDGNTHFVFAASPGTLTFDCMQPYVYGRILFLHADVVGIDSITNGDGETIAADQYRLLPPNGLPKYAIELYDDADVYWDYNTHRQNAITVAGTLGFCVAAKQPDKITLAATRLAAWLYETRDAQEERIQFADGASIVPAAMPPSVLHILESGRYIKDQLFVGRY